MNQYAAKTTRIGGRPGRPRVNSAILHRTPLGWIKLIRTNSGIALRIRFAEIQRTVQVIHPDDKIGGRRAYDIVADQACVWSLNPRRNRARIALAESFLMPRDFSEAECADGPRPSRKGEPA